MSGRVAFFSPLPPVISGIADYSADLLPGLAEVYPITLVTDRYKPVLPEGLKHLPVSGPDPFARFNPGYLSVYQMGNNVCHAYMLEPVSVNPGLVVLHDLNLHSLFYYLTAFRGQFDAYRRILAEQHGRIGEQTALSVAAGAPPPIHELPVMLPGLDRARLVAVHSRHAQNMLQAGKPGIQTVHVPMGIPDVNLPDKETARRKLGIAPDAFVFGSFGNMIPKKRVHVALEALQTLVADQPYPIRYFLVGAASGDYPGSYVRQFGLDGCVTQTGYVNQEMFYTILSAIDACINLRYPEDGETSAILLRALGAGKPVLYTPCGAGGEIPPGTALPIMPGVGEAASIREALLRIKNDPAFAAELSTRARHYFESNHRMGTAVRNYSRLISRLLEPEESRGGSRGGNHIENRRRFAGNTRSFWGSGNRYI